MISEIESDQALSGRQERLLSCHAIEHRPQDQNQKKPYSGRNPAQSAELPDQARYG